MSAGAPTRQRWRTFLRPRQSEQGASGAILATICVVASVAVFFGDHTGGGGGTVGSLAALPVLLAAWFLSRRWTLGITAVALALRVLALALGDVTAVTFVAQAIVLVVVALAVSIASSSVSRTALAQALAAQAAQAQVILDSALDAVITIDDQGVTMGWSSRAQEMFGWSAADVVGRPVAEFIIPPALRDAHRKGLAHYRDTGKGPVLGTVLTIIALHRDGREFPIELAVSRAVPSAGGTTFIAFVRDISERRGAETALAAALAEAEAASRAKSEYLSRVSHELRTPLTVIVGFAGLLEMEDPRPDQEASIAMVLQGGDQLLRMIDDLLEISRVESGREEVTLTAVRVDEVIAESVALVALSASQRRVAVHHDLETSAGERIMGDAQRLRQVMLNLLTNAIKYNREGGHVDISVRSAGGDRLRLTVRDSGPGIAHDLLPRLFQPFDRLGAERTTVTGTGLGLALSKHLVETMDGTIGVVTEPGKGAAFWVELARATEAEEGVADAKTKTAAPAVTVMPSRAQRGAAVAKTALYVEDNLANLELVQRTLEHRPAVRLLPLMQGGLALDLAVQQCPDLILLDVHLPDINGDEVLRRLKSDDRTRNIPVIMLSADATPNQASRFRRAGAGAYLTKPIRVRELLSAIDDALAGDRSAS
jgi:PAS domain S-box-containing protein